MKLIFNFALAKPLEQFEKGTWLIKLAPKNTPFPGWLDWGYAIRVERPKIENGGIAVLKHAQLSGSRKLSASQVEEIPYDLYTYRSINYDQFVWRSYDHSAGAETMSGGP